MSVLGPDFDPLPGDLSILPSLIAAEAFLDVTVHTPLRKAASVMICMA